MAVPLSPQTDVQQLDGVPEILEHEIQEERRAQAVVAPFAEEEAAEERRLAEERQATEARATDEMREELEEFKERELTSIVKDGEAERREECKRVEQMFKAHEASALADLLEQIASGSILHR